MPIEEWKTIPLFEGYQASSLGRIKSDDRLINRLNPKTKKPESFITKGKILKPKIKNVKRKTRDGSYSRQSVNLYVQGKNSYTTQFVHRLVLMAFKGLPNEGMVCCHNDGNALNNQIGNLRWGSLSDNSNDTVKHGNYTHPSQINFLCFNNGESCYNSKLNEDIVRKIREIPYYLGLYTELSKKYGVKINAIKRSYNKQTWKHI